MRHALIVAWKEFRTFFQTPIAYVILFVFTLIGGWWFFELSDFFGSHEASIRGLLNAFPWLFLFFAPAITMRLWAEERRGGTIETLLTLPLRDWEIVLGKFLAAVGLIAVWIATLLPIVGVVYAVGAPDKGPIIAGFLAALLLGASYAAIGIAASAMTENQIISLVVGVALAFFFFLVGFDPVVQVFPDAIGGFLHNLSLHTHFQSITRGVIDSRDLVYYASFIIFFLMMNIWLVRRTRGSGTTVLLTAGIVVLANYVTTSHFFRIDLTDAGRYTLAADTKRILGNLDDDLRLTAYMSKDVPSDFTNVRRDIADLVHEFESYAKGHLRVEIVNPDENDKAKEQAKTAGIQPVQLEGGKPDELRVTKSYMGLVVEFGDKTEKLPVIPNADSLEYELIRRIAKITRRGSVKIAWQVGDPMAGMNIPGMRQPPGGDKHTPTTDLRAIDQLIKEEYETTTVDLKSKVPDDVKVVVLCNPDGMSETQEFWTDQFLMRGGGLIVLADGSAPQSMGMQGGGSPYMRGPNDKLPEDFFSHFGFKINKDVVLDLSCAPVRLSSQNPFPTRFPVYPIATSAGIDQNSPITAGMRAFIFVMPSSVTLTPKPGVTATELVRSSDRAKHLENFMMLSPESILPATDDEAEKMKKEYKDRFLLAGFLEGNFQSYFVVHPVPKDVAEGKPAEMGATPNPFGETEPELPAAAAKSPVIAPANDTEKQPATGGEKSDGDKSDGGHGESKKDDASKPDEGKPNGGPRFDEQDSAAPPAPAAKPQNAPKADGGKKAEPAKDAAKKEEAKPFDYLKQSSAPGKILVVGSSEFASDDVVQSPMGMNAFLIQGAADYMASENLSSLRVKRFDERPFEAPSDAKRTLSLMLGWFAAPVALLVLLVIVYVWRRIWRPAASRRRMAAAAAK